VKSLLEEIKSVQAEAECIFTAQYIEHRVLELASQFNQDFKSLNPIFICILNGGLPFTGALISKLNFPLQLYYLHLSRFQCDLSGNDIRCIAHPQLDLEGKVVVFLDDILDVGISLLAANEFWLEQVASLVKSAVLLKKKLNTDIQIGNADYIGFECPNSYVFGYGMDYKNYLRNLNGIYALKN